MPREAPVTRAVLPVRVDMIIVLVVAAADIVCSGFSPRSLAELSAEHWQTTL